MEHQSLVVTGTENRRQPLFRTIHQATLVERRKKCVSCPTPYRKANGSKPRKTNKDNRTRVNSVQQWKYKGNRSEVNPVQQWKYKGNLWEEIPTIASKKLGIAATDWRTYQVRKPNETGRSNSSALVKQWDAINRRKSPWTCARDQ